MGEREKHGCASDECRWEQCCYKDLNSAAEHCKDAACAGFWLDVGDEGSTGFFYVRGKNAWISDPGFNTGSMYWLKAKAPVAPTPGPTSVNDVCPDGYEEQIGVDYRGNDIEDSCGAYANVKFAAAACSSPDSSCMGFSVLTGLNPDIKEHGGKIGAPWCLKTSLEDKIQDNDYTFCKKTASNTPGLMAPPKANIAVE